MVYIPTTGSTRAKLTIDFALEPPAGGFPHWLPVVGMGDSGNQRDLPWFVTIVDGQLMLSFKTNELNGFNQEDRRAFVNIGTDRLVKAHLAPNRSGPCACLRLRQWHAGCDCEQQQSERDFEIPVCPGPSFSSQ